MAQVFHPSMNVISRASLLAAVVLPVVLLCVGSGITRSSANTKVDVPLDQPVPFSHQHHVSELGIDCRYCHTTVEKTSFAGVPPTHTCMSCHSQIWTNSPLLEPIRESYKTEKPIRAEDGSLGWNRVNKLPEFVFFNHSIHIDRGINCNQCHGAVNKMQLTYKGRPFFMSWCLKCHTNPEKYIYQSEEAKAKGVSPREQVFDLYYKASKGEEKLSDRERSLINGEDYEGNKDEAADGAQLIDKFHVKKDQLQDCWICHR
jgi:hypothetical protein